MVFEYDEDFVDDDNPGVGPTIATVMEEDEDGEPQASVHFFHHDPEMQKKSEMLRFEQIRRAPSVGYKFYIKKKGKRVKYEVMAYKHGGVEVQPVAGRKKVAGLKTTTKSADTTTSADEGTDLHLLL